MHVSKLTVLLYPITPLNINLLTLRIIVLSARHSKHGIQFLPHPSHFMQTRLNTVITCYLLETAECRNGLLLQHFVSKWPCSCKFSIKLYNPHCGRFLHAQYKDFLNGHRQFTTYSVVRRQRMLQQNS